MALTRAVLCGSKGRHPYQLAPEALERSADGNPTHFPIQNSGYGPVSATQYHKMNVMTTKFETLFILNESNQTGLRNEVKMAKIGNFNCYRIHSQS